MEFTTIRFWRFFVLILLAFPFATAAQVSVQKQGGKPVYEGYLKANGKKIVDGAGQAVLLRGMGLGGWMLQEGYMLETADFAGTQHEIRDRIRDVAGQSGMERFYNAWLANHVTRADIDSLAGWGFNSVRPALHYNLFTLPIEEEPVSGRQTWIEKGFIMLDSLISWCAANRMYVILDLHAAPGGQGRDNNIADRDPNKPSLWDNQANRTKTIELWKRLAERYADNQWVGGYDVINETNWDFENSGNQNGCNCQVNAPLLDLMKKIINAIRLKDSHHLIFIEGNCWSGNWNGLEALTTYDRNLAFSFHRYWNSNDVRSIQEKLSFRDQYNIPLWMGESGENSNHWFADAITLLEQNDIGWSWWPEKKINSIVGPATVIKTREYQQLLSYWRNGGTKPDTTFAIAALMQIAENLKIANCVLHPDVTDALFRQQLTNETKPFADNRIPGTIHAVDFDLGRNGYAYRDIDYQNTGGPGPNEWNKGFLYRNDGPDIEACSDSMPYNGGYNLFGIESGEWLAFTVWAEKTGIYDLTVRAACASGMGAFRVELDSVNVTGTVAVPHTGGTQRYFPIKLKNIPVQAGRHRLTIYFEEGGFSLNTLAFDGPTGATMIPFTLLSASTGDPGQQVVMTFNGKLSSWPTAGTNFLLTVGDKGYIPDSVTLDTSRTPSLKLWFSTFFTDTDRIRLSWNGNDIVSADGETLPVFTDLEVVNTLPVRLAIPGTLEAEACNVNSGFSFENCTDTGGGKDAGYTDPGDYLEFQVRVAEKAQYRITYRYSCNTTSAQASLSTGTDRLRLLQTVVFNGTGGWQNWNSVTLTDSLQAGPQTIRFTAVTSGFNLNRIQFVKVPGKDTTSVGEAGFKLYPNPAGDFFTVEITNPDRKIQALEMMDMLGRTVYRQETSADVKSKYSIATRAYRTGMYFIRLGDDQSKETQPLMIKNKKQ